MNQVGWEVLPLGEVALIQKGMTITGKTAVAGPVPVIAGGKQPAYFHNASNRDAGCITVSASGAYAGYVSFHDLPIWASDCITIEPAALETITREFMHYFLLAKQQEIYGLQRGSGMPHVYGKDLAQLEIPLPSLDEQRRIVANLEDHLSRLDKALADLDHVDAQIKIMERGIYQKYGQGGEAESMQPLLEVCDVYQPKTIAVKDLSPSGKYPVYGANGQIGYFDDFNHESSEVTITCRGATCGTVNVIPAKSWITGNAMVVKPKAGVLSKEYLALYLRGLDYRRVITGTAQPQITRQSLAILRVPTPSPAYQYESVQRSKAALSSISVMQAAVNGAYGRINEMRRAVLHAAFTGGLVGEGA